jgi:hypothetical protein
VNHRTKQKTMTTTLRTKNFNTKRFVIKAKTFYANMPPRTNTYTVFAGNREEAELFFAHHYPNKKIVK